MIVRYDTNYLDRLVAAVVEFYNVYSNMGKIQEVIEQQITRYIFRDKSDKAQFSISQFQSYLANNQGPGREMVASWDGTQILFLTIQTWPNFTAKRTKKPPQFQATLSIRDYDLAIKCSDDMAYKLVTRMLTAMAFVQGDAFQDRIKVDGESFKFGHFVAACFYKLTKDEVGYAATLDEARDDPP